MVCIFGASRTGPRGLDEVSAARSGRAAGHRFFEGHEFQSAGRNEHCRTGLPRSCRSPGRHVHLGTSTGSGKRHQSSVHSRNSWNAAAGNLQSKSLQRRSQSRRRVGRSGSCQHDSRADGIRSAAFGRRLHIRRHGNVAVCHSDRHREGNSRGHAECHQRGTAGRRVFRSGSLCQQDRGVMAGPWPSQRGHDSDRAE